jgi:hypothetical protein
MDTIKPGNIKVKAFLRKLVLLSEISEIKKVHC